MTNPTEVLNTLTPAQETESWNRQRTNEELKDFVTHHMGRLALEEDS